jgi:hypothetical protein
MTVSHILAGFRTQQQVEPLWCWAAAASMIDDYYSRVAVFPPAREYMWQCQIVADVRGPKPLPCLKLGQVTSNDSLNKCDHADLGLPGCWNPAASVEDFENLALNHTRYAQMNGLPEPYHDGIHDRVRKEIDNGHPVAIKLVYGNQYEDDEIGHFNVIFGYIGTHFYYLADPADNSADCRAISDIRGWTMTVFTKPYSSTEISSGKPTRRNNRGR